MPAPLPSAPDIRPLCAARQAPPPAILDAVGRPAPDQAFRLIAPVEPAPLHQVPGRQGFSHETRKRAEGAWQIDFRGG